MVALKAGDIESFLQRIKTSGSKNPVAIYLVYGPDTGLVHERASHLARSLADDPEDPFQLIRLDGDLVAADPARLIDEANTIGFFASSRVIWVRSESKSIAPAVEIAVKADILSSPVIIEAGDIKPSSPLRNLCEKAKNAYVIPCYADSERDIAALLDRMLKDEKLTIRPDARSLVLDSLGADRLATRNEIEKLVLYAVSQTDEITLEDVEAVMANVSGLMVDTVIDAAFCGKAKILETDRQRLAAEGVHGSVILGSALRHAFQLLALRLDVETGKSAMQALEGWRGLYFKRKPLVQQQLGRLSSHNLKTIIGHLQQAILETRHQPALSDVITARVLLMIAVLR